MIFMPRSFSDNSGCIKFVNGDKEISIACNDSCGRLEDLSRSDIRCFQGNEDITTAVFQCELLTIIPANLESFQIAWDWLRK